METSETASLSSVPTFSSPGKCPKLRERRGSPTKFRKKGRAWHVNQEIKVLLELFPQLSETLDIVDKIGEGTFSCVYLGISKPPCARKEFAVKHIIPTSHPNRIHNELLCMKDLGGKNNVIEVKACLRNKDHTVVVMPFFPHERFQDYFTEMSLPEVREYMFNLLVALRHVHCLGIIHRDVKPSNFLYNRADKKYALVDFGLAQTVEDITDARNRTSVVKPELQSLQKLHQRSYSSTGPTELSQDAGKQKHKRKHSMDHALKAGSIAKKQRTSKVLLNSVVSDCSKVTEGDKLFCTKSYLSPRQKLLAKHFLPEKGSYHNSTIPVISQRTQSTVLKTVTKKQDMPNDLVVNVQITCVCLGKPQLCKVCLARKSQFAPRAGTPGFRPLEVLLKYPNQTTAVDMWAAGVIFLSLLSGCYPFFRAPDDVTALAQIITLKGVKEVKATAKALYRKNLICSEQCPGLDIRKMCRFLHHRESSATLDTSQSSKFCRNCKNCPCLCKKASTDNHGDSRGKNVQLRKSERQFRNRTRDSWDNVPQSVFDLIDRLLDVNCLTRITAEDALKHTFFSPVQLSQNEDL